MGQRQNIISMLEKNTNPSLLGNIIYSRVIESESKKINEILRCIRGLKLRLRMLYASLIMLIIILVSLSFHLSLQDSPYALLINFLVVYFILVIVGILLFRARMLIPFRYNVFVHEIPGRVKERSIVIVSEYIPKGRDVIIIPTQSISKIGIIETERRIACTNKYIRGLEVFILDMRRKEITRFGFFGKESEVREVALDLWSFVIGD